MKRFILFPVAFLLTTVTFSQVDSSAQVKLTRKFKNLLPEGYIVIDSAQSDFNGDKLKDVALVLEYAGDKNYEFDSSRAIYILKNTGKGYIINAKCFSAILSKGDGGVHGDPYDGISFKKNVLKINHFGGSAWKWTDSYVFRYQHNNWELIGTCGDSFWVLDACESNTIGNYGRNFVDVNFSTKRMHVIKRDKCTLIKDEWTSFTSFPKVTLNDFYINGDYLSSVK
ncbi:hypothetical protein [Ferruginibacter albus]|uniref:hypothetical protein n=1 Tax=Ferruginibacter albus TaxID=2875540 RepID=UPI001CC613F8|nr:hypothetical protein [Ferruginibacter albus]UAY52598.1 hypothetical protein K9M53_02645 [Ferruginibacter albus]